MINITQEGSGSGNSIPALVLPLSDEFADVLVIDSISMTFWDSCGGNTWPVVQIQSEKCEVVQYLLGEQAEVVGGRGDRGVSRIHDRIRPLDLRTPRSKRYHGDASGGLGCDRRQRRRTGANGQP